MAPHKTGGTHNSEEPTVQAGAPIPEAEVKLGSRVGRYEVEGRIGSGGMGVVLAARDPELGRKVAIKLVRPRTSELHGSDQQLAEARAVARLSHANVVPVFDVGMFEGRVFMAMELVEGQTLSRWLEEPRPYQDVLARFIEAGKGLAAAHDAGVSHRDFKPSNVLVGDDGRVRVMDFGIAGSADDEAFDPRRSAQELAIGGSTTGVDSSGDPILGTPAYMAPEQALGETVTHLSDQFSFCVALWKGLYGTLPFSGSSTHERIDAIESGRFNDVPRSASVPRSIQRVLRRGLRARPEQRWPDMPSLLRRLERAQRPSFRAWYAAAGLGAVLAVAAIPGAETPGGYCDEAANELAASWNDARRQDVRTAVGEHTTEDALATIEHQLDGFADRWRRAHTRVCEAPDAAAGAQRDAATACLSRGLQTMRSVVDLLASAGPELQQRANRLTAALPDVTVCADPEALTRREPRPADAQQSLAVEQVRRNIRESALAEAAGRYEEAVGLAQEAVDDAGRVDFGPARAEALQQLGDAQLDAGDYAAGRTAYLEAWDEATASRHDRLAVTAACDLVYTLGYRLGDLDEAETWIHHAEAALERWGRGTFEETHFLVNLATQRAMQGRHAEALTALEEAIELRETLVAPDNPSLENAKVSLANELGVSGRLDEALAVNLEVLRARKSRYGELHPDVADSYTAIGLVHFYAGRREQSRDAYREAIRIVEATLGDEHAELSTPLTNLAAILNELGDNDEALEVMHRALRVVSAAYPSEHRRIATIENNLGVLYRDDGRDDLAVQHFERATELLEKAGGPEHLDVASPLTNLGSIASDAGRLDEAEELLNRALKIREAGVGPDHDFVARTLVPLGTVYARRGDLDAAQKTFERVIEIAEATSTPDHPRPQLAVGSEHLAGVLLRQGDRDGAIEAAERALKIRRNQAMTPTAIASAQFELAKALYAQEPNRALALAQRAHKTYAAAGRPFAKRTRQVRAWLEHPQ